MDLPSLRRLLTPLGQQALVSAQALEPREADFLGCLTALQRSYPLELARPALETAILRREAATKFPQASIMYFTREALEQASGGEISAYRANRYAGFDQILDLGCSIGGDTLALTSQAPTLGIDIDPLRLALAQTNFQMLRLDHPLGFIQADLTRPFPLLVSKRAGGFFDPGRRTQGRRVFSVRDYSPPLSSVRSWLGLLPAMGIKISPGVNLSELRGYEAELEFISVKGELKEAVLWFGSLLTTRRRATLLPGPFTLASEPGEVDPDRPLVDAAPPLPLEDPQGFLYEPDPAILRAGLVRSLGARLDLSQLDPDIAYLTADRFVETPFAVAYQIEDWLPFNLKRLRSHLHQRGIEQVVVKKRGSPIEPEALIHQLRLKSGSGGTPSERVLVLTHLRGKPIALICKHLDRTLSN